METPLLVPKVSPVGLLESPPGFGGPPRKRPAALRLLAAVLLAIVVALTVLTTVASLGSYCLTTEPGDVRPLRSLQPVSREAAPPAPVVPHRSGR